ncbi:MAG: TetR/AcrR family transcriptional regulator [Rhodobacteraceae bacterium]|nr:TetR/AcrR family transcriptional regulator [Paracoccaceae bacterium]
MSTEPDLPTLTPRLVSTQATMDRLISAAHHAFATEGFAATSLDRLAETAMVTRGALHHHFTNKAGLFEAVLRRIDAEITVELQEVWLATADPWDGMRSCIHLYLDAVLRPDRKRILLQDAPAVLGVRAFDILAESGFDELVADLQALAEANRITPKDAEALAHLLNGAIASLALWVAESDDENRHARAHTTLAALLDGLTV